MLLLLFLSNVQPQRGLHARGDRDVEKSHFLTFCSEKTDKYVKTPRFCAVFSVLHLSSTHFGPRWETRTPDILLPNLSGKLFLLVYSGFQPFSICFTYSLTLLSPLFPGVPAPSVVIYVVKNASHPVSGEDSPVPDGKRFSFLCGLYCNSEQAVMQVVSARVAAQRLRGNKQRNSENGFFKNIKGDCFYYQIAIY